MRAKIITWNPINTKTSVLHASLYIKPTLEILEFFNRSPNKKCVVRITETGSGCCYANQNMFATIDKSADVPNKRDNFFDSTGMYVITLHKQWYGFPLKNGYIEFQEGITNDIIQYVSTCDKTNEKINNIATSNTKDINETYVNSDEYNDKGDNDINNGNNGDNDNGDNDNGDNGDNGDNCNDSCKKLNNNSKGFDGNILLICGISLALIMVLTLNN